MKIKMLNNGAVFVPFLIGDRVGLSPADESAMLIGRGSSTRTIGWVLPRSAAEELRLV